VGVWPARRFALLVLGLLVAQDVALPRLAARLRPVTPRAVADSIERRLRRALGDGRLDDTDALFVPLARHALRRLPAGRCCLLLDDTPQTDTGAQVTLLALAYGGRALPLAWCRWTGPLPVGAYWRQVDALLTRAAAILPPQVAPVVLADRGLGCGALARLVRAHGWHYLLRLPGDRTVRLVGPDGRVPRDAPRVRLDTLVRAPRERFAGRGHLFARDSLDACVVAVWLPGHASPWLLVTDLGADTALTGLYAQRMRVEALFRDAKSGAFHWEASHVLAAPRADRLLLALMAAVLCATLLGEAASRAGECPAYGRRPRAVSCLRRGLDWLAAPPRPRHFRWILTPTPLQEPKSVRV
jgi:hypothetical protein